MLQEHMTKAVTGGPNAQKPYGEKDYNTSEVCENVSTVQKDGRGQNSTLPLLYIKTWDPVSQLHPACVFQCDKISLTIIPFLPICLFV